MLFSIELFFVEKTLTKDLVTMWDLKKLAKFPFLSLPEIPKIKGMSG
jgi:hypothetical protein